MAIQFIKPKRVRKISHREWLIGFSATLIVIVSFFFPQKMIGESFWILFFLYFIFPLAIILFILKEPLENFGFTLGNSRRGIIFGIIFVLLFFAGHYWLVFYSSYGGQIPVVRSLTVGFLNFFLFEIFLFLPMHFFSEVFFRGFLQMGLEKRLGIFSLFVSIALQTAPYARINWVVFVLIGISSLSAGMIARQSRSIYYSAAAIWLISLSLDIMIIRIINQGQ